jgi:2-methylcitrate dehydratase PrpD
MGEIAEKLAGFAARTQFKDIPADAVHETKRVLLDSFGCAVAGLAMDRGRIAAQLARKLGGLAESTVIGTGDRVSCTNAAYANAELINDMDFDAMCAVHDLPAVVSASLALAERGKASGQDLILAIAVANEVATRIKSAEPPENKPIAEGPDRGKLIFAKVSGHSSSVFGAVIGAGKLLGLDQEKMANALGTSGFLCIPNTTRKSAQTPPVRMSKYGLLGWAAQGGVTAALLAEMGFEGDTDLFEGDYSYWRFTGQQEWKAEKVLEDLGAKWKHKITIKQYPVARPIAGTVYQFIELIEKNHLQPADIEKVKATVMPFALGFRIVRENKLRTIEDCCFSMQYAIACAAYRIDPTRWLDRETREDTRVLDFMKRVELISDEKAYGLSMLAQPVAPAESRRNVNIFEAEIVAKGQTFKSRGSRIKGEPEPGFRNTDEEVIEKFQKNVTRVLPSKKVDRIVRTVLDLDKLEKVSELMQVVSP